MQGRTRRENILLGVTFIFFTSVLAQILFSSNDFFPTDNGFYLAGSRRIVDGEVPYRDFTITFMPGSLYLHSILAAFGGDYVFWISRYIVLLEIVTVSWIWSVIAARSFKISDSGVRVMLALICFCFTLGIWFIDIWGYYDALFFASLGLLLVKEENEVLKSIGYFFLGLSPLFRQSFLFFIGAVLLSTGGFRRLKHLIIVSTPAVVFIILLSLARILDLAMSELTFYGFRHLMAFGVYGYLNVFVVLGLVAGFCGASLARYRRKFIQLCGCLVLSALPLTLFLAFILMWHELSTDIMRVFTDFINIYYLIFGAGLGALIHSINPLRKFDEVSWFGFLAVALTWSLSLSNGLHYPVIGSGVMTLFLLGYCRSSLRRQGILYPGGFPVRNFKISLLVFTLITLMVFIYIRQNDILQTWSDHPETCELGNSLSGAKNIFTIKRYCELFDDLNNATVMVAKEGKTYTIIPDLSAYWVRSPQRNPISSDWPLAKNGMTDELKRRVFDELDGKRGDNVILIEKYNTILLYVNKSRSNHGWLASYVVSKYNKSGETEYFEIYE